MTPPTDRPPLAARTSYAIDNLRAVVILLVLAFHAVLAYLSFLPPRPFAFDAPPFLWRAFPIVDAVRWPGFDLFCAWLDVFLMSFFFLLSGLFVWPSLARRGAGDFITGRLLRLGAPFVVVVLLVMPPALYPAYLQSAADPSLAGYWRHWQALPFWPSGPMWFLWLLLTGDLLAASLYRLLARRGGAVRRLSSYASERPARFLSGLALLALVAYVPLALMFGPSTWGQFGPFALQLSRPLHYALYFLAGVAIGACGIENGLLAIDGRLVRRWRLWLLAAVVSFAAWIGLTALAISKGNAAPLALRLLDDASFSAACLTSCFLLLALALRFAATRRPALGGLQRSAYGMYLVHYHFIVWLQFALLSLAVPAVVKATLVFAGTLTLSWAATSALAAIPAVTGIIGGESRRLRALPVPGRPAGVAD